jgi:hypothetical protein
LRATLARTEMSDVDPHDEIEHLEAQIEELASTIESCRKFILAARIAMAMACLLLVAMLFGFVWFDPRAMIGSFAALLGGIVVWGSNGSTAEEASKELAVAEANRKALIGMIDLREVAERTTVH